MPVDGLGPKPPPNERQEGEGKVAPAIELGSRSADVQPAPVQRSPDALREARAKKMNDRMNGLLNKSPLALGLQGTEFQQSAYRATAPELHKSISLRNQVPVQGAADAAPVLQPPPVVAEAVPSFMSDATAIQKLLAWRAEPASRYDRTVQSLYAHFKTGNFSFPSDLSPNELAELVVALDLLTADLIRTEKTELERSVNAATARKAGADAAAAADPTSESAAAQVRAADEALASAMVAKAKADRPCSLATHRAADALQSAAGKKIHDAAEKRRLNKTGPAKVQAASEAMEKAAEAYAGAQLNLKDAQGALDALNSVPAEARNEEELAKASRKVAEKQGHVVTTADALRKAEAELARIGTAVENANAQAEALEREANNLEARAAAAELTPIQRVICEAQLRLLQSLEKHSDPRAIATLAKSLEPAVGMTRDGKETLLREIARMREAVFHKQMEKVAESVIAGVKAKSPEAISNGVKHAKLLHDAFTALSPDLGTPAFEDLFKQEMRGYIVKMNAAIDVGLVLDGKYIWEDKRDIKASEKKSPHTKRERNAVWKTLQFPAVGSHSKAIKADVMLVSAARNDILRARNEVVTDAVWQPLPPKWRPAGAESPARR